MSRFGKRLHVSGNDLMPETFTPLGFLSPVAALGVF